MKRKDEINHLINECEKKLPVVEEQYIAALGQQNISINLKADIRQIFQDLRSILDFIAHEIIETYSLKPKGRFYFPILPNQKAFHDNMNGWFPGLEEQKKPLYDYLASLQPFQIAANSWLKDFNDINNENKHDRFTPQTKNTVNVTTTVQHKGHGGNVTWSNQNVKFGDGVRIFGAPINPQTQMPVNDPSIIVTKTTWIDFQFEGTNISALKLIRTAIPKVKEISIEIEKLLM